MKSSTFAGRACIAALGAILVGSGCGGSHPPPSGPESEKTAAATDAAPAAAEQDAGASSGEAQGAASENPPLAAVLVTDQATIQKLFDAANASPSATLKAKGISAAGAPAKGVRDLAKVSAPGMKPDGPLATGTLEEKKHSKTSITLEPTKCYTVVGYSATIKDLDLHVMLAPGVLSGEDTTDDNKPVVGKAPDAMCPMADKAITYMLDIMADSGSGEFAVQLYSKDKTAEGKAKPEKAKGHAVKKEKGADTKASP